MMTVKVGSLGGISLSVGRGAGRGLETRWFSKYFFVSCCTHALSLARSQRERGLSLS